jgi:hypothetical protein
VRLYPFIEAENAQHGNLKRACELLKVSRSAYYAAREASPSPRAAEDAELAAWIGAVHEDSKGLYGAPRAHAQLQADGRRHSPQAGRPAHTVVRAAGPCRQAVEEDYDHGPGCSRESRPGPLRLHRRRLEAEH